MEKKKVEGIKELEEFLDKRDYAGAISLLEVPIYPKINVLKFF